MKTRIIDFAEDFHCLAGDCTYTCCKGWQLPVDEETYARYLAFPGIRGRVLRSRITKKEPRRIKKLLFTCPFLTSNKLCRHQCRGEELLMPVVCRNYPRRVTDYGDFHEVTLEMSCPEVARIFLNNPGRHDFVYIKENMPSVWDIENDDKDFLSFLEAERLKMLDYIWDDRSPLFTKWETLYAYVYNKQDFITRDRISEAGSVKLTEDKSAQGVHAIHSHRGYAFYSLEVLDKMILEHIDYGALILRVPKFYRLIKRYLKIFSKLRVSEANRTFHEGICKMCEDNPGLYKKYVSYFSYALQQEFLECYESYSLIRELTLCILYTELLMLFDYIEYRKKGRITREREREILFLSEHNIRHNPFLTKELYNVIREEML